ncbi:hypothetical protein [Bordetella bronchiseptica]|uniref:hypothetical protein n=1 Tax=Bordetella bronchiseptica TaxID=518 RepID=UPI00081D1B65|nr:hypothetical protein [Bordetella bronchiseptica]AOB24873.1 hypothetical protein BBB44_00620 [Bordetella bronchiseptica]AZW42107.1 hypothetical protein CWR61_00625 [Bordetella bronchiseptica]
MLKFFACNDNPDSSRLAAGICALIVIAAIVANTLPLQAEIAYRGYNVPDWVYHVFMPQNFGRDFPNGVHNYAQSSYMQLYLVLYWLGMPPEQAVYIGVALEIAALAFAIWVLTTTVLKSHAPLVAAILVALAVASNQDILDISRTGRTFFVGLYYGIADAARLLAIAYFLRKRWLACCIALAASVTTHPIMGGLALAALGAAAVSQPREWISRRSAACAALCLALIGLWLWIATPHVGLGSDTIPKDTWVAYTRLFNVHWYTQDLGLLGSYLPQRVVPLLALIGLFLRYLPSSPVAPEVRRALLVMVAVLMALTVFGVCASIWWREPFLIKLNLQRGSLLAATLALPVVVAGLAGELKRFGLRGVAAITIMLAPFYSAGAVPLIPAIVLILPGAPEDRRHGLKWQPFAWLVAIGGYWWVESVASTYVMQPAANYFIGPVDYIGVVGIAYLAVWAATCWRSCPRMPQYILAVVVAGSALYWQHVRFTLQEQYQAVRTDYYAAQIWARDHTSASALFFVDPTLYYGWRDYSRRASFGNLREWLHTSWLYDTRASLYEEGLRRFNLFGLNIASYLSGPPAERWGALHDEFIKVSRAKDDAWRLKVAREYGIDYFVLPNGFQNVGFPVVFRNANFTIYKTP